MARPTGNSVHRLSQERAKAQRRISDALYELEERRRERDLFTVQLPSLGAARDKVLEAQDGSEAWDTVRRLVQRHYEQCEESLAQSVADIIDLEGELKLARADYKHYDGLYEQALEEARA